MMIGDMFNYGLKARVDALCGNLAEALRQGLLLAMCQLAAGPSVSLSVPAAPSSRWLEDLGAPASSGSQNDLHYAFFLQTPLTEVEIAGRKSLLKIDSGASRTTLYPSYAAQFGDHAASWARKKDGSSGLGGNINEEVAFEPQLAMMAGGRNVIEHDVSISLNGDKAASILGNLGQTFLTAKGSYTFDFRSMRLLLGDET
jgi:hypothetical protein